MQNSTRHKSFNESIVPTMQQDFRSSAVPVVAVDWIPSFEAPIERRNQPSGGFGATKPTAGGDSRNSSNW